MVWMKSRESKNDRKRAEDKVRKIEKLGGRGQLRDKGKKG